MKITTAWPELTLDAWLPTYETLHRWLQIVGKIRLAQSPWINHSWQATLYVTPRGLTTAAIPHGDRSFRIDFDFIDHVLVIEASDGNRRTMPLRAQSVADFHAGIIRDLALLELPTSFHGRPNELEDDTPFAEDHERASYDPEYAHRAWVVLSSAARVMTRFRAEFLGKSSPVHFFWGSFDLAVTRFSGRTAPEHPGGIPNLPDWVVREAYSHEVASAGFWPGSPAHPFPVFYAYAYPEPEGYAERALTTQAAFYSTDLREFVLPYESLRLAEHPEETLLAFLRESYAAAAELGGWDRAMLERRADPRQRVPPS